MSGTVLEGSSGGRRFHIHVCLGRGGFGEVYRATMSSSGGVRTEVAVKVLRDDIDPGSEAVKRLRDEGRLLGALRHPAILRVHDLVLLEGRVALVTEYVEGEDLDGCLAVRGEPGEQAMPLRAIVAVVGEVAAALDAAWSSVSPFGNIPIRLVHRDVKPANVRLGRHGEVKLLDFGIARATNVAREAQTATNAMMGSYLYMAPERFHEENVAPPSDVYALGCVLFEGLTRNRLMDGMTLKQIYGTMLASKKFHAHLDARKTAFGLVGQEPRTAIGERVPPPLLALLDSMLDPDPARRPVAGDLARRCEDLVEGLEGATLKRWARQRTWPSPMPIVGTLDGRDLTARSFQGGDVSIGSQPNVWATPLGMAEMAFAQPRPGYSPSDAPPRLPLAAVAREMSVSAAATPEGMQEVEPDAFRQEPTLGETPESPRPPQADFGRATIDPPSGSLSGDTVRVRAQRGRVFGGVALLAIMGGIVAVGSWLVLSPRGTAEPEPDATSVMAPATPAAIAPPEEEETEEEAPPPAPVPEPKWAVPAPVDNVAAEPPPRSPGGGLAQLRDRAWSTVDGDPGQALALFDEALAVAPGDADSLYGRGYALMKLGRAVEASGSLCDAVSRGDSQLRTEVRSVMTRNGLSCP